MAKVGFNLNNLYTGSLQQLRNDADYFSKLTKHGPTIGKLKETYLVKMLRRHLPPKIGLGTGTVVSGGSKIRESRQCDIVLYDAVNNSPFAPLEDTAIYPIEMVYGIIEVKSTLTTDRLRDAFEKCALLRSMAQTSGGKPKANKAYVREVQSIKTATTVQYQDTLPPRFVIFSFGGLKTMPTLKDAFVKVSDEQPSAHIHGLCNLGDTDAIWMHHKAYTTGPDRYFSLPSGGLKYFFMRLPQLLNSMPPGHRLGLGFDQVDLSHYNIEVDYDANA